MRVDNGGGGMVEIRALLSVDREALTEWIGLRRRIQLDDPIERVVGDHGNDLAALVEEGNKRFDTIADVSALDQKWGIAGQFSPEQAEVLQRPRVQQSRTR